MGWGGEAGWGGLGRGGVELVILGYGIGVVGRSGGVEEGGEGGKGEVGCGWVGWVGEKGGVDWEVPNPKTHNSKSQIPRPKYDERGLPNPNSTPPRAPHHPQPSLPSHQDHPMNPHPHPTRSPHAEPTSHPFVIPHTPCHPMHATTQHPMCHRLQEMPRRRRRGNVRRKRQSEGTSSGFQDTGDLQHSLVHSRMPSTNRWFLHASNH